MLGKTSARITVTKFELKKTEYETGDRALTLYNLVLVFLNCHIFIAKLFQVIPSKTNPGISACRAALCRYMYFHLYKYRQPVPGHQAGELRILVTFPGVRKPIKKAEKWTRCVCAPFCSPVSPGESKAGSNGSGQLSHCLTLSLLLVLCASNVHSYFFAGLN